MKQIALLAGLIIVASPMFAQKQLKPKSPKELQALQALFGAQTPDAKIAAADELVTKFADTDFKAMALQVEADAYEQKGQHEKAIVYAEQAVATDPGNFDALTLLANIYSSTTRDTDLDKAEKLSQADKYAAAALAALKTAVKPNPQMTDEQWNQYKGGAESQAYQAMGNSNVVRKKYDDAQKNYEMAVASFADPYTMIRAGRAMMAANKADAAIAWFDKALASPQADENAKNIATTDKARATSMLPKK